MDDFGYTYPELRDIELAGAAFAESMAELRSKDEQNKKARESHIPWTVIAGRGPDYSKEGAPS